MKKTCVFLIGTNCSGKTTCAKELIRLCGGMTGQNKWLTQVADGRFCFAGKYGDGRYGGVDSWNETKPLRAVVERALTAHDVIVCEGVKLHNNGGNLSTALFSAERRIVVFLYAPAKVLDARLRARSGSSVTLAILKDQQACARSLKRWAGMGGVKTLAFDTSVVNAAECASRILSEIKD